MTVRGIEAIKLYLPPPTKPEIDINIKEEKGRDEAQTKDIDKMTSVERYRQEWVQLLRFLDDDPEHIRGLAFNGELKVSKFRSIYWALLLRVLSADHRSWNEQRKQQRERYEKLREEFVKNPREIEVPDDDPLSQSSQSVWNQYFSDQELFAVVRQDVVRTFPGVDFFRKPIIQNAMCNILFYYAREHPYMCYRQGMHEILAPILFVKFSDHQSLLHFKEIAKTNIDATLLDVLNPDYLEADTYSIFSRLMSCIESYYRISNSVQNQGYIPINTDNTNVSGVEVIGQLNSIRDKILAKEDLHLHNYMLKLDIPLHIFGIRWLRLLFGREFPLLDLLMIWDAIFADSDHFDLPNYILVAMLIRIRDKLLLSDQTTCLTYLMRYPATADINLILCHALHMLLPKKFALPPNAFVYFTTTLDNKNGVASTSNQKLMSTLATNPTTSKLNNTTASNAFKVHAAVEVSTDLELQKHERIRSTSLSDAAKIERQITLMQARNAEDSAALARLKIKSETNRFIMDGYAKNSPELMRLELKNAQTVITIARNKLQVYLATVRKNVTNNNSGEMAQALDGIEELCSFLDVKFMFPLQTSSAPIDQALEANEHERQVNNIKLSKKIKVNDHETTRNDNVEDGVDVSLKATATVIDASSSYLADSHPLPISTANANYEKPDSGFMFNSARILGNLREIELMTIASDERIEEPTIKNADIKTSDKLRNSGLPSIDPLRHQPPAYD